MTGTDANLLHMERTGPTHTIKVLMLDTSHRGRPVTREDLAAAATWFVERYPRARQVVRFAPVFKGLPFWLDEEDFDVAWHLHEQSVVDQRGFDLLLGQLAGRALDRSRPLWSATLVDRRDDGSQAIVICVHHAIADGMASVNALRLFTSDEPGVLPPDAPKPQPVEGRRGRDDLFVNATLDMWRRTVRLRRVIRDSRTASKLGREFRSAHKMPNLLAVKRNYLTDRFDERRSCAMTSLPLADLRAVGKATSNTVNGVLHAVVAGALRRETEARGLHGLDPMITTFGIASDASGSDRVHGNSIDVAFVNLHTDIGDPLERLNAVADSTRVAVELRRTVGLGSTEALMDYAARFPSVFIKLFNKLLTSGHLVTANVPGPRSKRWINDVLVADWVSFAIIVPPYGLNITAHSYAGSMNIGLVAHPDLLPDPHRFLDGLGASLAELQVAVGLAHTPLAETRPSD